MPRQPLSRRLTGQSDQFIKQRFGALDIELGGGERLRVFLKVSVAASQQQLTSFALELGDTGFQRRHVDLAHFVAQLRGG